MMPLPITALGGIDMKENEAATQWEDRFEEAEHQVANMDEIDFLTLLLESRVIQAF